MVDRTKRKRPQAEPEARPNIKGSQPSFLYKVYEILEEPVYSKIISWNEAGTAFVVKKVTEFTDKVLPKYFKHRNFSSFVRQLNMYDFHKIKGEEYSNCFAHPQFHKGGKHIIKDIKRKVAMAEEKPASSHPAQSPPSPAQAEPAMVKPKDVSESINDLNQRLMELEERDRDHERLVCDYREMSERNQKLEQMLMYFTHMMAANTAGAMGREQSSPTPHAAVEAPPPQIDPRLLNGIPMSVPMPPLQRVLAAGMSPYGRCSGNGQLMGVPMIEGRDKTPREEVKEPISTADTVHGQNPADRRAAEQKAKAECEAAMAKARSERLAMPGELMPGMFPGLAELMAARQMFSPGVSPSPLGVNSPFNPAEACSDREPNYLRKIELSPVRSWGANGQSYSGSNGADNRSPIRSPVPTAEDRMRAAAGMPQSGPGTVESSMRMQVRTEVRYTPVSGPVPPVPPPATGK